MTNNAEGFDASDQGYLKLRRDADNDAIKRANDEKSSS